MESEKIFLVIGAFSNLAVLLGGLINIISRLTKIETDIHWIKKNCAKCGKVE